MPCACAASDSERCITLAATKLPAIPGLLIKTTRAEDVSVREALRDSVPSAGGDHLQAHEILSNHVQMHNGQARELYSYEGDPAKMDGFVDKLVAPKLLGDFTSLKRVTLSTKFADQRPTFSFLCVIGRSGDVAIRSEGDGR
jgi:hypothetical protein